MTVGHVCVCAFAWYVTKWDLHVNWVLWVRIDEEGPSSSSPQQIETLSLTRTIILKPNHHAPRKHEIDEEVAGGRSRAPHTHHSPYNTNINTTKKITPGTGRRKEPGNLLVFCLSSLSSSSCWVCFVLVRRSKISITIDVTIARFHSNSKSIEDGVYLQQEVFRKMSLTTSSGVKKWLPANAPSEDIQRELFRRERIDALALGEGIKWGVGGTLVGGAGTAAATIYNKNFAKFMSASAKTSIPVMVGVFLFSLQYELTMYDANRYVPISFHPLFIPNLWPLI